MRSRTGVSDEIGISERVVTLAVVGKSTSPVFGTSVGTQKRECGSVS